MHRPWINFESSGRVEFRDVTFHIKTIVEHVTFKAEAGQTVALHRIDWIKINPPLVNLLPRFYDVSDGQILVDGVNVHRATIWKICAIRVSYIRKKQSYSQEMSRDLDFSRARNAL